MTASSTGQYYLVLVRGRVVNVLECVREDRVIVVLVEVGRVLVVRPDVRVDVELEAPFIAIFSIVTLATCGLGTNWKFPQFKRLPVASWMTMDLLPTKALLPGSVDR